MQSIISKYQALPKYQRFTLNALFIYTAIGVVAHSYITGPKRNYGLIIGKVVIITGCSAGIGKETARALAKKGAIIIFACRNKIKTEQIMDQIYRETKNNKLFFLELDLDHQSSIHKFVEQFKSKFSSTKIDILINNAGIADWELKLHHGIERIFHVNQLGWFLLTLLILPLMDNQARIINVASEMHRLVTKKVDIQRAIKGELPNRYAISKYAMIATTKAFQERLDKKKIDIKIVSLCPGGVRTEINDKSYENQWFLRMLIKGSFYLMSPFTLSEREGASTSLYCALQPYEELQGGKFYHLGRLGKYSKQIEQFNQGDDIFRECLALVQMQDI